MADLFGTYEKRIKVTIDHTDIDSDVSWFPITNFITSTQMEEIFTALTLDADFDRMQFTKADGATKLYADCEMYDVSESKAIYHISASGWTISSSVDTDFYVYYQKTADHNTTYISKSGGTAAQSVYDGNTEFVCHGNDATTSTMYDSTSNNHDATKVGANTPAEATGKVGYGQDFANGDSVVLLDEADFDINYEDELSVECIIYRDDISDWEYFISKLDASSPWPGWEIISGYSAGNYDDLYVQILNTDTTKHLRVKVANVLPATTWLHIGFSYDGSGNASGLTIYVNGVLQSNTVLYDTLSTNNPVSTNPVYLGSRDNADGNFAGIMDEPRIHMAVRSAAWWKATYNSLFGTLLTYGSEETGVTDNSLFFGCNF